MRASLSPSSSSSLDGVSLALIKCNTQARWHLIFMRKFAKKKRDQMRKSFIIQIRTWYFYDKANKFLFHFDNTYFSTFLLFVVHKDDWESMNIEKIFMRTLVVEGERLRHWVRSEVWLEWDGGGRKKHKKISWQSETRMNYLMIWTEEMKKKYFY